MLEAIRGFTRYPALAATMERNGVRGVAAYAAATHLAAALQQDVEALALGQCLIALIDGARAAGSVTTAEASGLVMSFFEAAGAGACIITDAWEGIEQFLEPGKEILVARDGAAVAEYLEGLAPSRAEEIGAAARARVLAEHTYAHRARQVDAILQGKTFGNEVAA